MGENSPISPKAALNMANVALAFFDARVRFRVGLANPYRVWVGGIDDHYETEREALDAVEEWKSKGYDDVQIEYLLKYETDRPED